MRLKREPSRGVSSQTIFGFAYSTVAADWAFGAPEVSGGAGGGGTAAAAASMRATNPTDTAARLRVCAIPESACFDCELSTSRLQIRRPGRMLGPKVGPPPRNPIDRRPAGPIPLDPRKRGCQRRRANMSNLLVRCWRPSGGKRSARSQDEVWALRGPGRCRGSGKRKRLYLCRPGRSGLTGRFQGVGGGPFIWGRDALAWRPLGPNVLDQPGTGDK